MVSIERPLFEFAALDGSASGWDKGKGRKTRRRWWKRGHQTFRQKKGWFFLSCIGPTNYGTNALSFVLPIWRHQWPTRCQGPVTKNGKLFAIVLPLNTISVIPYLFFVRQVLAQRRGCWSRRRKFRARSKPVALLIGQRACVSCRLRTPWRR